MSTTASDIFKCVYVHTASIVEMRPRDLPLGTSILSPVNMWYSLYLFEYESYSLICL